MTHRLIVIGNPGCRRVARWQAASDRLGWAGFDLVSYADLLQGRNCPIPARAVVRIESPESEWETYKLLLKHGRAIAEQEHYPVLDDGETDRIVFERGRLIRPRQAHFGFLRLLRSLESRCRAAGAMQMQSSEEIEVCFDKPACQLHLARHGLPIPTCLGSPKCYDELRPWLRSHQRLIIKLAHGSGAAGCVAIHSANGRTRAVTTVAQVQAGGESHLYHSKRPVYLTGESEIAALVNRLSVERVQAESWLPKARLRGRNIDLRVVTIDGVPRHAVVRSSTSVFTNLTLGSRRENLTLVRQRLEPDGWERVRNTCASVAAAFPNSFTLGIDVLIRPDWRRHNVLEVNAFGDLLVNEIDRGEDTNSAILNAWQRRTRRRLQGESDSETSATTIVGTSS